MGPCCRFQGKIYPVPRRLFYPLLKHSDIDQKQLTYDDYLNLYSNIIDQNKTREKVKQYLKKFDFVKLR